MSREYFEQYFANILENMHRRDKFLKNNFPKLACFKTKLVSKQNLNSFMSITETEFLIKLFSTNSRLRISFTSEFYQTFKDELVSTNHIQTPSEHRGEGNTSKSFARPT